MQKRCFFVTSTGTDIGKTFISTAIVQGGIATNHSCYAIKPIISGFDQNDVINTDTGRLITALGLSHDIETINSLSPWRYSAPISPDIAASREGDKIDFGDLIEFCQQAIGRVQDILLVEGVGGAMVPLDDHHTVTDWISVLDIPVLLVAGTYMGTISHILTALSTFESRHIRVGAIILNESEISPVSPKELEISLKHFIKDIPIISFPRVQTTISHQLLTSIQQEFFKIIMGLKI